MSRELYSVDNSSHCRHSVKRFRCVSKGYLVGVISLASSLEVLNRVGFGGLTFYSWLNAEAGLLCDVHDIGNEGLVVLRHRTNADTTASDLPVDRSSHGQALVRHQTASSSPTLLFLHHQARVAHKVPA